MSFLNAEQSASHSIQMYQAKPSPRGPNRQFPGLSYIPDLLEVAEDKDLMTKVYMEFLDFIQCITDLLDLMHLLKNRHLRSTFPIPQNVLREILVLGDKGRLYKEFDKKVQDIVAGISSSLDSILKRGAAGTKARNAYLPILHKTEQSHAHPKTRSSITSDLLEITGKKTKPVWHTIAMEKDDFLSSTTKAVDQFKSFLSVEDFMYPCKHSGRDIKRSPSEILQFSIKFSLRSQLPTSTPKFRRQMDMMLASKAGFSTVEAHKAYLATKKAQWYSDFLKEAVKLDLLGCQEVSHAFERLGRHYDMTRDSLPFAKAKLCLLIMSLPFWDVARIQTQRAAEFIMERILHIDSVEEQPLKEWLKVRKIPYVVRHPYTAEDYMKHFVTDDMVEENGKTAPSTGSVIKPAGY